MRIGKNKLRGRKVKRLKTMSLEHHHEQKVVKTTSGYKMNLNKLTHNKRGAE